MSNNPKKDIFNYLKSIGQMKDWDNFEMWDNRNNSDFESKDESNKEEDLTEWKKENLKTNHQKEIWKDLNGGVM